MALAIWFLLLVLAKTKAQNQLPIDDFWIEELLNTDNGACQEFLMDNAALSGTDACLDQPCDAPNELCSIPGDFMDIEPGSPEERDEIIALAACEPVPPECLEALEGETPTTKKPDATKPEQTTKKTDVTATIKSEDGTQAGKTTATQTTAATTPKPSAGGPVVGDPSTGVGAPFPNLGDTHFKCCEWARSGQCESNRFWMKPNCQEACGTPGCTVMNAPACGGSVNPKCMQQQQPMMGFGQQQPPMMPQQQFGQPQQFGQQPRGFGQPQQFGPQQQPRQQFGQQPRGFGQPQQFGRQQQPRQQFGQQQQPMRQQQRCSDQAQYARQCRGWSNIGECDKNPYFMKIQCAMTCNSCGSNMNSIKPRQQRPGCMNRDNRCNFWADKQPSECQLNPQWMNNNCALSCRRC